MAIIEGYHAQVPAKFFDIEPVSNPAIGLCFDELGLANGCFAPRQLDIGTLEQDAPFKVFGLLHGQRYNKGGSLPCNATDDGRDGLAWWGVGTYLCFVQALSRQPIAADCYRYVARENYLWIHGNSFTSPIGTNQSIEYSVTSVYAACGLEGSWRGHWVFIAAAP